MIPIYLDFNASTPIAPEVREAMEPYLEHHYGNPSAAHFEGASARDAVELARAKVAKLLGCQPSEVVFTAGGTESNNHALKGAFYRKRLFGEPVHAITTAIEHPSVLEACRFLERLGGEVTFLPVDPAGRVDPDDVRKAIRRDTAIVSVMHANNEVGTIQPIAEIGRITRDKGVLLHTDAAQTIGKIAVDVDTLGVDLLTIAGHKCYAPKGVGALYVRNGVELEPLLHGGGHEKGRRSGTENALLIVGLGAASELVSSYHPQEIQSLRDRLLDALRERLGEEVVLNGHPTERLPNTLNVSFVGLDASSLLTRVEELAASTGSACHTGRREMSPVLSAMGVAPEVGFGAVRLSLGRTTTLEEIDEAAERIVRACLDA